MSLMDRVNLSRKCEESLEPINVGMQIEELKSELYHRISSDEIASMISKDPLRAKNEIRSACIRILESSNRLRIDRNQQNSLIEGLIDSVFGLGPLESMLRDESITEIMVNGMSSIFYEREGILHKSNHRLASEDQVRMLIDRIIGPQGRRVDESSPMVNARLEQGHRVNIIIPPLAIDGSIITIRKFREHLYSLDELVELGSIDNQVQEFLVKAVLSKRNIAVSGGTGSGKTTLLNALSCVIPHGERLVTIEDSAELRFHHHPHVVRLEARPRNAEGVGEVTIRELVINALRMRPDRIIVGECRSGEALDMLQAMNTGHDGSLTTLHANSPQDALSRLAVMVRYVVDLPIEVIESQIASALDIIVQTSRGIDGRRYVREIAVFTGNHENSDDVLHCLYHWDESDRRGYWTECSATSHFSLEKRTNSIDGASSWIR